MIISILLLIATYIFSVGLFYRLTILSTISYQDWEEERKANAFQKYRGQVRFRIWALIAIGMNGWVFKGKFFLLFFFIVVAWCYVGEKLVAKREMEQ